MDPSVFVEKWSGTEISPKQNPKGSKTKTM